MSLIIQSCPGYCLIICSQVGVGLQYTMVFCATSCLENPRDGGAWWAAVYGVSQSRTRLKRLSSSSSCSSSPSNEFLWNLNLDSVTCKCFQNGNSSHSSKELADVKALSPLYSPPTVPLIIQVFFFSYHKTDTCLQKERKR